MSPAYLDGRYIRFLLAPALPTDRSFTARFWSAAEERSGAAAFGEAQRRGRTRPVGEALGAKKSGGKPHAVQDAGAQMLPRSGPRVAFADCDGSRTVAGARATRPRVASRLGIRAGEPPALLSGAYVEERILSALRSLSSGPIRSIELS